MYKPKLHFSLIIEYIQLPANQNKIQILQLITSRKTQDSSSLSAAFAVLGLSEFDIRNLSTNCSRKSICFGEDWIDSKWIKACVLKEQKTRLLANRNGLFWKKINKDNAKICVWEQTSRSGFDSWTWSRESTRICRAFSAFPET